MHSNLVMGASTLGIKKFLNVFSMVFILRLEKFQAKHHFQVCTCNDFVFKLGLCW